MKNEEWLESLSPEARLIYKIEEGFALKIKALEGEIKSLKKRIKYIEDKVEMIFPKA